MGYDVDIAHDGLSALELVRQKTYDVALLDLKLPGTDGLTLYREITSRFLDPAEEPCHAEPFVYDADKSELLVGV